MNAFHDPQPSDLTPEEKVSSVVDEQIAGLQSLIGKHEEHIATTLAGIDRQRLLVGELRRELAAWRRLRDVGRRSTAPLAQQPYIEGGDGPELFLPETPSCSLCPPDGGCSFACEPA